MNLAAPPDSLVLCYQGRSVAILRPADLNELREQTRSIFGLSTTNNDRRHPHAPATATTTRNIIRFFYYTAAVAPVSRPVLQSTSSKKRQKRGTSVEVKREERSPSTLPGDEDAETDEEEDADGGKPPATTEAQGRGPTGRQRKRELGETLLPRLPDDFELHVEIVNVPIKRLGIRDGQARGSQRASSNASSLLSEENLARLDAAANARIKRPARGESQRIASSAPEEAVPPLAVAPPDITETGILDKVDGVWRCIDCGWEIVRGECASCARKYIKLPASRQSQPFERESCPVCDHEVVRDKHGYICSNETCPFDCPSEGNSVYSDVTAAIQDHHYGSDSDTGTETHIYGHNPAIDYASSISEAPSPAAGISSSEEPGSSELAGEGSVSEASSSATDYDVLESEALDYNSPKYDYYGHSDDNCGHSDESEEGIDQEIYWAGFGLNNNTTRERDGTTIRDRSDKEPQGSLAGTHT